MMTIMIMIINLLSIIYFEYYINTVYLVGFKSFAWDVIPRHVREASVKTLTLKSDNVLRPAKVICMNGE